uniref:Uncharacterized protein n=1 Tax=Rhizophora mucronata TaxID=61149 RepID=A0A2P2PSL0_RHIMU
MSLCLLCCVQRSTIFCCLSFGEVALSEVGGEMGSPFIVLLVYDVFFSEDFHF